VNSSSPYTILSTTRCRTRINRIRPQTPTIKEEPPRSITSTTSIRARPMGTWPEHMMCHCSELKLTTCRPPSVMYVGGQSPDAPMEGERGLLGAVGGGVAGAAIGQKTCHGFLGTVGGAIVGSLTEDWVKRKSPCNSRPSSPQPPPACPPGQVSPQPPPSQPVYCAPVIYGQQSVDTHTAVTTQTHVNPWPSYPASQPTVVCSPPSYPQSAGHPNSKPCGHTGHCACAIRTFWKS
jgi:hypothetical protein